MDPSFSAFIAVSAKEKVKCKHYQTKSFKGWFSINI